MWPRVVVVTQTDLHNVAMAGGCEIELHNVAPDWCL